ncbi:NADP-dependent oxidoreductase [Photobacterium sp. DNB23_23_1]|uniref:NADP-dependent oxidoreductase n=1 Tax=Photobacterium pectinilyticum TaxID=2906793 RepID=A0ABT1N6V7_9GAMM|nr:NADP-dependent oxidoreductase [Photobacterium sp. ZSDE20]MCQ1058974.1 NADP-dependent oxidoreductase [Photobacterium sp. ZSDE20]MDD1824011.1 NADP-dependent oxidoreductase [Photobacterium sp. ZSDE20]
MNSQQIHLASRPEGTPTTDNFELHSTALPDPREGEVLVKNTWMSVDPYMRGRMVDRKSYVPPFQIGEALEGGAIGEVTESNNPDFPVGSKVSSMLGWRTHFISNGEGLTRLPETALPDQSFLGIMGMPGMTAWTGLFRIAELKPTDTVFISAASGAVGSIACQIAKMHGCKVIGSVGSQEKADYLLSLGVDAVINYKETNNLTQALAEAAPQGIDVYFENVGGEHLEATLNNMNDYGRIAVCGLISQYNATEPQPGPSNMAMLIIKKLKMQGFIVFDHWAHYGEYAQQMGQWITEGKIKWEETVFEGIDQAPNAFIGLFEGKNKGKMLVKL